MTIKCALYKRCPNTGLECQAPMQCIAMDDCADQRLQQSRAAPWCPDGEHKCEDAVICSQINGCRRASRSATVATIHGALNPLTPEPNEALVKGLRDLLAMAESGRLQSFIGTGFCDDGKSRLAHWTDSHDDVYQMLGAIEWLKAEYIQRHT